MMNAGRLRDALDGLAQAMAEVNAAMAELNAEHDPLALHIFAARRRYRATHDSKSGRRREIAARLSYDSACGLGFGAALTSGNGCWVRFRIAEPRSPADSLGSYHVGK